MLPTLPQAVMSQDQGLPPPFSPHPEPNRIRPVFCQLLVIPFLKVATSMGLSSRMNVGR